MVDNTRINWIDYAKVFSIFCVVLIHLNPDINIKKCICTFDLPIFYFISGYLFSYVRNPSYKKFVWKRFRQLVIPYLWINVVAYIIWFIFLRHFGNDIKYVLDWHIPLIGIITCIPPFLIHDIPLWSLLSFFIVDISFYGLYKIVKNIYWITCILVIVNILLVYVVPIEEEYLPLALGPSISGLCFYSVGYIVKKNVDIVSHVSFMRFLLALIILVFCSLNNTLVDFYICEYGNYILYVISAATGCYVIISCSVFFSNFGNNRVIMFISKSTLLICGFHLLSYAFIKGVCKFILKINPELLGNGTLNSICFALAGMLLTLPVAYVIMKKFNYLIDKK